MGNCLVIQHRKFISFVDDDSEILKAALPSPAPLPTSSKVVVVSSDAKPQHRQLDMAQLYRLFQAPTAAADPAGGDVVRVKLVISKQELRRMLGKDGQQGVTSVDDVVALMGRESSSAATEEMSCCRSSAGWRPALQSIPEGRSDFF